MEAPAALLDSLRLEIERLRSTSVGAAAAGLAVVSEALARALLAHLPAPLLALSPDGVVVAFERGGCGAELEALAGRSCLDFVDGAQRAAARAALERAVDGGQPVRIELGACLPGGRFPRLDCQLSPLWEQGQVVGVVALVSDLGARRGGEAEDREGRQPQREPLQVAHKMEAVGQLTAGIAHHFNNMLMGILPNVQMAADAAPAELKPLLRDAEQAAARAAAMVKQLSTFSGHGQLAPRRLEDLSDLVEQALAMHRERFDAHIAIDLVRDDSAPLIVAEAAALEHALLNVLLNARDAVLGAGGAAAAEPRIAIVVERVPAAAPELAGHPGALPVEYACVRISDNGVGMDGETLAHLYEPFFTTKGVGRGTGLGLATTYAIVREHGGFIRCSSTLGQGTRFSIYFPGGVAGEPVAVSGPPRAVVGHETILVVDDEAVVRSVVDRVLRAAGYRVELCADGSEALDRFGSALAGVDLALVDVSMPGLAGPALVQRLRELRPELRVLYLTGYRMQAVGPDAVLEKPVSPEELLAAVRAALG